MLLNFEILDECRGLGILCQRETLMNAEVSEFVPEEIWMNAEVLEFVPEEIWGEYAFQFVE